MNTSLEFKNFLSAVEDGQVCVFETDTVVGIGCKAFIGRQINPNTKKIFAIKKRDISKPLPLLFGSVDMVKDYIQEIPDFANTFINDN